MLTGRVPFVSHVSFAGVDTRDVAEFHIKALTDPRAWEQRIIAAILGRPLRVTRAAVAAAGKSLIAEGLARTEAIASGLLLAAQAHHRRIVTTQIRYFSGSEQLVESKRSFTFVIRAASAPR